MGIHSKNHGGFQGGTSLQTNAEVSKILPCTSYGFVSYSDVYEQYTHKLNLNISYIGGNIYIGEVATYNSTNDTHIRRNG